MANFIIVPESKVFVAGAVAMMPALRHLTAHAAGLMALTSQRSAHLLRQLIQVLPRKVSEPANDAADHLDLLAAAQKRGSGAVPTELKLRLAPALEACVSDEETAFVTECILIYAELDRRSRSLRLAA